VSGLFPRLAFLLALGLLTAGCSKEARTLEPDLPQTPPDSAGDPRASKYEGNVYQIAQGGRYFAWYCCGSCHASEVTGRLNLGDSRWVHGGAVNAVYSFIAHGHPGKLASFGARIPTEQLWQLTAYVRSLPDLPPERRRRQDFDQVGEPQGRTWSGPVE
jgi:cytochrome c oxidase cbb3-type subunit 3